MRVDLPGPRRPHRRGHLAGRERHGHPSRARTSVSRTRADLRDVSGGDDSTVDGDARRRGYMALLMRQRYGPAQPGRSTRGGGQDLHRRLIAIDPTHQYLVRHSRKRPLSSTPGRLLMVCSIAAGSSIAANWRRGSDSDRRPPVPPCVPPSAGPVRPWSRSAACTARRPRPATHSHREVLAEHITSLVVSTTTTNRSARLSTSFSRFGRRAALIRLWRDRPVGAVDGQIQVIHFR